MKKITLLSVICLLLITVSLIFVACKPTTPSGEKPSTEDPTTPPVTENTTDYTYQFNIGTTPYKAVYQKAEKTGSSVLKLYENNTLKTQKVVTESVSSDKTTVTLSDDYREIIVKLTDDKKFTVQHIDNDFDFIVGYDFFTGVYTSNDILTPNGKLTVDSQGKATLEVDNKILAQNASYFPWLGRGIMLTGIDKNIPTSSAYITINKDAKTFTLQGYSVFKDKPEYIFDTKTIKVTTERTDIPITTLYSNSALTQGYLVQSTIVGDNFTNLYIFGNVSTQKGEINLKSYTINGEEKTYRLTTSDGKIYDWAKTVHKLNNNRKLTLYYDDYAIYVDIDDQKMQGKVFQDLSGEALTIMSTTGTETLNIVLDSKTYDEKYIIKDKDYNGLDDATIYKDSEGKGSDLILFEDSVANNEGKGYFLLKSSPYYMLHKYKKTTDWCEVRITVEAGDTYDFIINEDDMTYTIPKQ